MKSKHISDGSLKVTWFGHSAFSFVSPGGKMILADPWLENPSAPSGAKEIPTVDLILLSHGHSDHFGNTIEIAKRTNARVISNFEISLFLKSRGISSAEGINIGGTTAVDGITVSMVPANHSSDIDIDGTVVPGGHAAGFIVKFEDRTTIYFAGDTNLFGDMKYIRALYKPDVAFLPIGGYYTMAPREAALACELIAPKRIIGMHYGTFPILAGTPAELRRYLPSKLKRSVFELEPGKTATIN